MLAIALFLVMYAINGCFRF